MCGDRARCVWVCGDHCRYCIQYIWVCGICSRVCTKYDVWVLDGHLGFTWVCVDREGYA